jgi:hypothetical protein
MVAQECGVLTASPVEIRLSKASFPMQPPLLATADPALDFREARKLSLRLLCRVEDEVGALSP